MANTLTRPAFRMSDEHRVKIQNSNILNAIIEHIEGRREMSATQVSAGIAMLKKTLPDLAAIQISGDGDAPLKMVIEWQKNGAS